MRTTAVQPGQRFRNLKAFGRVWEVETVYVDNQKIAHARLRAVNDPKELRTLACSVLMDAGRFQRLEEEIG